MHFNTMQFLNSSDTLEVSFSVLSHLVVNNMTIVNQERHIKHMITAVSY